MIPMSELNPSQRAIAEHLDGMLVVDAGPGTGKTHTIVDRYINLISRDDVSPRDVLLLTFTRNAANEMEERIKKALSDRGMQRESKLVQAKTFDSFCLSVIMDAPEDAGALFGIEERLSRGAAISSNDTLNRQHFRSFLDRFLNDRGADYGDWAAIVSQYPNDLYALIEKLMSRGLFPLKRGWFGMDAESQLRGDADAILDRMLGLNKRGPSGGRSKMADALKDLDRNNSCRVPAVIDGTSPSRLSRTLPSTIRGSCSSGWCTTFTTATSGPAYPRTGSHSGSASCSHSHCCTTTAVSGTGRPSDIS